MSEIWNPGYSKFTYFWEQWPFSQWSKASFYANSFYKDINNAVSNPVDRFNCCEQYMMAEKATVFGDHESFRLIMKTDSPREHKKLGRNVKGFDKETWEAIAKDVVYHGNYNKFTQCEKSLQALRDTQGTLLVEASPYDMVWGIGLNAKDAEAGKAWKGTNWLGEVLTKLDRKSVV